MRNSFFYISMTLLMACGGPKETVKTEVQGISTMPNWVQNRPVSSMDYIGIGRANKSGPLEEYQALAKKNALNDMAGEIQVKVNSNSLLYTLEHDERFSASFTEQISTQTSIDLEGFEAYDNYETPTEYWVYYRLNKAQYEQVKQERQRKAIERSFNNLNLARKARFAGNVAIAAEYFIKSMGDLKLYWGEDNYYPGLEDQGAVDGNALSELMDMRNNFKLKSDTEYILLNIDNGFEHQITVRSMVDGRNSEAAPFIYRQGKGESKSKESDLVKLNIKPGDTARETLSVEVDPFLELRKSIKDPSLTFLKSLLRGEVVQIDIQVSYPSMSLECVQIMGDGPEKSCDVMRAAMMMQMAKSSIAMDSNSQYRIRVIAKSRDGGMNQGFQVVYTDVNIIAQDLQSDEIHFEKEFNAVKGVHSNLEMATTKSLQKASELINEEMLKSLLDSMF